MAGFGSSGESCRWPELSSTLSTLGVAGCNLQYFQGVFCKITWMYCSIWIMQFPFRKKPIYMHETTTKWSVHFMRNRQVEFLTLWVELQRYRGETSERITSVSWLNRYDGAVWLLGSQWLSGEHPHPTPIGEIDNCKFKFRTRFIMMRIKHSMHDSNILYSTYIINMISENMIMKQI